VFIRLSPSTISIAEQYVPARALRRRAASIQALMTDGAQDELPKNVAVNSEM
jgi:hypothetical protein